jgi:hypothetical protein
MSVKLKEKKVVFVLMAMVWSVISRLPNSLCPLGKNPWQDTWVKWSLFKVRKGNTKGAWHCRWNLEAVRMRFCSSVL